jgi:O-acetylhomoserine/O-acetylserine sulfhydrylase-like pyridoxal-dependent enzyme
VRRFTGIVFHFVDMNEHGKFKSLINENTRWIWVEETPTNPYDEGGRYQTV